MDNDKALTFLCVLLVGLAAYSLIVRLSQPGNETLIKDGKYWSTDCTLKETDIPGSIFTRNTNRLDCSGVIVHVGTDRYERAVSAYNKSTSQE